MLGLWVRLRHMVAGMNDLFEMTYSDAFERVWRTYPMFPKGRSKKKLAHNAWLKCLKELDIGQSREAEFADHLVTCIDKAKRDRKSWQTGDPYGPQALQAWLHQHAWNDDYVTVRRRGPNGTDVPPWRLAGFKSEEEWLWSSLPKQ